jgi:GxxExxY protein
MIENSISEKVIGSVIEVHRILGPGLLESVYENALCHELFLRNIKFERQKKYRFLTKEQNQVMIYDWTS